MRIAVSGSTGFIGSELVAALKEDGHEVLRLVRRPRGTAETEVRWSPEDDYVDRGMLDGSDVVVHLAGESIVGRWTDAKRESIRRSRVEGTSFLAHVLASLAHPPRVFLSASAVGYYGNRGDEMLTEDSPPGGDFLAGVCRDWETATEAAAARGVRVVNLRFGAVLDPGGGVLKTLSTPFKLGLGGRLGSGRQYMSWITRDDTVEAIKLALRRESLAGPVNVVSPNPVTNAEFTRTLARVLSRPALLPMPERVLTTLMGDMAREMLLASQRVNPRKLTQHEFHYRDPQLEGALRRLLRKD